MMPAQNSATLRVYSSLASHEASVLTLFTVAFILLVRIDNCIDRWLLKLGALTLQSLFAEARGASHSQTFAFDQAVSPSFNAAAEARDT
jgi:hypothetical protein